MKCKKCKREIPENSIYCNWCGVKQIKDEIKIPEPQQLPSGTYRIRLNINGMRKSISAPTRAKCIALAKEMKTQLAAFPNDMTMGEAVDKYISERENILSVSTVRGYKTIKKTRFLELQKMNLSRITNSVFQSAVNDEAKNVKPKTIKNACGLFIAAADKVGGLKLEATLPQAAATKHPFLEPEQIQPFIDEFKGQRNEAAVLLGLHSLRKSEILGLRRTDYDGNYIHVHCAMVLNEDNELVLKDTTKTASSTRDIPILIPRLKELLPDALPLDCSQSLYRDISGVCEKMGIPNIGVHGLRHSFASLCAHLKVPEQECMRLGGWSSPQIMREVYTHVAESDRKAAQESLKNFYEQDEKKS